MFAAKGQRVALEAGGLRMTGQTASGFEQATPFNFVTSWAAEWSRLAYPTVQPAHRFAAALMATTPPELPIRAPWPYFLLTVPDGLLTLLSREHEPEAIRYVMVIQLEQSWSFIAAAGTVEYSRIHQTLDMMRNDRYVVGGDVDNPGNPDAWRGAFHIDSDDHDYRSIVCVTRLLLNASIAMSDAASVRRLGKAHRGDRGAPATAAAQPKPMIFELNRPVTIDCREAVRTFVRGGRSRLPSVQWLVRGHWRQQPIGPARAQRRLQWIEPFWKGGDGAPLVVRPHVLRGPDAMPPGAPAPGPVPVAAAQRDPAV
jgi:hypothetical protein